MKVLVTGGAGYIGRVLVPMLKEGGYEVTVLDRMFLNYDDVAKKYGDIGVKLIKEDIRFFDPNILKGMESVIDLAALSNDPAGEIDPIKTWDINYLGRIRVARLSKKQGVERYILASSCSVYGFREDVTDENSKVNPLTTYAMANREAERDNLTLADSSFAPTALRFATAFGYSEKMRLDIALNAMTFYALKTGGIRLMRDGNQYRPFIHVKDISRAIIKTLESEKDSIRGEIFNIGDDRLNIKLAELAQAVKKNIDIKTEIEMYGDPDTRSYRVSFKKAHDVLRLESSLFISEGVREISDKISSGELTDREQMHTVDYYRKLMVSEREIQNRGYNIVGKVL